MIDFDAERHTAEGFAEMQRVLPEDDLIQLICWLSSVVTKQADVRHEAIALPPEECRKHLMMKTPIVQTSRLQQKIRELGDRSVDQDALRRALEIVSLREESDRP